jgi:hypothetical protein
MVAADEVVEPGQDSFPHVQEAFPPGDAETGQVPEAGLEFGGVALRRSP